jgi:PAS domain S-box-containing protein
LKSKQIKSDSHSHQTLREKAELKLIHESFRTEDSIAEQENLCLVHQVAVHQIELEMQNEELKLAKELAETALKKYADLYDFAPLAYYTLSQSYEIVELNIMGSELIGKKRNVLLNRNFASFVTEDTKLVFSIFVDKVFESESKETGEIKIKSESTNDHLYVVLVGISVVSQNGDKQCLIEAVDVTKKVKQQKKDLNKRKNQVNKAKSLYRLLANNTSDLICLLNLDSVFEYVSPSVKALSGYLPEDFIGKKAMDFVHPEDVKGMTRDWYKFISGNLNTPIQFRHLNLEGKYIWLETSAKVIFKNEIPVNIQTSSRDISYRKEAEFVLERTLKQECQLNELRTNLVSTISHEFRTPMSSIRVNAELMDIYLEGTNFDGTNKLRKQINRITDEVDRIVDLMNAVLVVSKDDSGKTNFKPSKFDLKKLCCTIIENSFSNDKDNRIVEFQVEGNQFLLYADEKLIEYAILNVLSNAFKYSENCGNVVMKLTATHSDINVEIQDFGIGIPKKDQPKLFNTFFRASNSAGITGTGLGLYIVKTFIERNSGTVILESRLGKGTKVMLQFPKC